MPLHADSAEFVNRLGAAWLPERWRDVHVLVAVSGGADSVALLRGMLELKRQSGGAGVVHAAHVNHQLRGAESDADEEWLRQQCRLLEAPLVVERSDVAMLAGELGDGIEAAAREARFRLLTAAAESMGARFVVTGHTLDDQVETILFRLVRGTGLRGLAGIRPARALVPSVALVRPLLSFRRSAVLEYLAAIGQDFREDASNRDRRFARNRVRQELLPFLRENLNADVDAAVARVGELAGEAQALIEEMAEEWLGKCRVRAGHFEADSKVGITLATAPLAGRREILVCEVLRRAWREAGFAEQAMTHQWWRELALFAQSSAETGSLNLPGNIRASRPASGVLALRAMGLS